MRIGIFGLTTKFEVEGKWIGPYTVNGGRTVQGCLIEQVYAGEPFEFWVPPLGLCVDLDAGRVLYNPRDYAHLLGVVSGPILKRRRIWPRNIIRRLGIE